MTSVLWRGRAESVLLRSIVFVMVSVIFAITVISNPYARPEKQLQGWLWLIPILVLGGALVAAVMFTRLSVEVTDVEVRIVYGWGYRWVPWRRGSAAVMRAGSGFRFDFANGKVFVVTVDDADAGLEIIRGVLATK